jgi:hypothetical protein
MSVGRILLFVLAALVWVGGGNLVRAASLRRKGRPFSLRGRVDDLDGRAWLQVLALAVVTMALGILALQ